jgi:peroxin-19
MENLLSAALAELDADEEGFGSDSSPAASAPRSPTAADDAPQAMTPKEGEEVALGQAGVGRTAAASGSGSQPVRGDSRNATGADASSTADTHDLAGMEDALAAIARSAEAFSSEGDGDEDSELFEMLTKQLHQIGLSGDGAGLDSLLGSSGSGNNSSHSVGGGSGPSDEAIDGLLDGLVGQLLSKEVMLEPMQTLHAEFPRFLAEKGSSLSSVDRSRYERQQVIVAQIVEAYEQTPNDTDRVAQLMQDMQACGPPPSELAAPGLPSDAACCIS